MELDSAYPHLEDYGCKCDQSQRKLFISREVVLKAVASAPKIIKMFDREGNLTAELRGNRVHFDPGSAAIKILDFKSGVQREPTLIDLPHLGKIVSNLSNFAMQSTALVPTDVPEEIKDCIRLYAGLKYCPKPIITGTFRKESFGIMKEMLMAVRNGAENLRQKPFAIFDCCPSPPLRWSELTASAVVDCAQSGIPAEFVSMPLLGATSPPTIAGALVQHTAETLSGIVLAQSVQSGAPVIYGGSPSAFDMRYGTTPMGAIETMLIDTAYAQIGKSFGLPTHAYMGLSDSRKLDYQAGLESGMGAVLSTLAGINVVSGAGMMDFESCQSFEKLVIDNEICGMTLRLAEGISPLETSIGYELIARYAESRDFMKAPETRKLYRSQYYFPSKIIERSSGGSKCESDSSQRAHNHVEEILAREAQLCEAKLAEEIAQIMLSEAKKFGLNHLAI
jgi:trimethylamine--corrinoid protein Co-methyltransferase